MFQDRDQVCRISDGELRFGHGGDTVTSIGVTEELQDFYHLSAASVNMWTQELI